MCLSRSTPSVRRRPFTVPCALRHSWHCSSPAEGPPQSGQAAGPADAATGPQLPATVLPQVCTCAVRGVNSRPHIGHGRSASPSRAGSRKAYRRSTAVGTTTSPSASM